MRRAAVATSLYLLVSSTSALAAPTSPGEVSIAVLRDAAAVEGLGVFLDGRQVGTTDAAGRLSFKASSGLHRLVLDRGGQTLGYTEFRLGEQDAAELSLKLAASGGEAEVERQIYSIADVAKTAGASGSATQLGAVTVKGAARRNSPVQKERVAAAVVDVMSAEEIAVAGDGNAAEALKRVTGVSVQDDVIVVRGLGDRYSTTLVNGAEIPSFNPSRRVVSADAFPSEFIGGLTVQKTYSPELPGEFSGGAAIIETQPIPEFQTGRVSVKLGGNTQTTFSPVLTYEGSPSDYIGVDGGTRALPDTYDAITADGSVPLSSLEQSQREALLVSLPDNFDLQRIEYAPVDFGGSLSYGDVYTLGGTRLGFLATGLYDTNFRFRFEDRAVYQSVDGDQVAALETEQLQRSEQTFDTGGTLGIGAEFNKNHAVNFVTLLSRQTQKGAFFSRVAQIENALDQQRYTLDYVESQLLSNQLTGKHRLPQWRNLSLRWQLGYSTADRDVLDRRSYTRSRQAGSDAQYQYAFGAQQEGVEPRRTWEYLTDDAYDGGLDFSLPLQLSEAIQGDLKWGLRATRKQRDFESVRLGYQSLAGQRSDIFNAVRYAPSLESIATTQFFGDGGFDIVEVNSLIAQGGNANIYNASQDIRGYYLMADINFGTTFEVQVGARLEESSIDVLTGNPALGATLSSKLDDSDVLPAMNATWYINRKQQLRAAVSQSLNRPQFRELTPVEFLDPDTRFLTSGNPTLQSAKLTNYDLRFEQYWSNSKAASIGVFYKDIQRPIEFNIGTTSGGQALRSFSNAQQAYDLGVELDGRYTLDALARYQPLLAHVYIAGNLSWIESEATLASGAKRNLQGQSNYLANATLGYTDTARRTDAALLFNIFGARIAEVGFAGLPNAIEQSYPVLDFNLRQGFGQHWQLGLKARNLLNPEIRIEQGIGIQRSYQLGRSGELSLQYQF